MPTITVDGQTIEAQDRQSVLQACLDADAALPHYCYHPGLSVPASCRICLVEVEGMPKLVPSCFTPVREGMIVHSKSPKAVANQKQVMEYLLINHPLDCPVCDQSGECYLQDYSYGYGRSQSRFEEDKSKNPKKVVGEHVLLYADRCIMCTRCVRFTREVSGTGELFVNGRGHREEIDIFPGRPLDNKLSGNVVDLCPVGALLDRDFLFKQRVWLLKSTPSISPVDSGGENILLQANENVIYRVKPRHNPAVNQWWISDDTRYSYKAAFDDRRLTTATLKKHGVAEEVDYSKALDAAVTGLKKVVDEHGEGSLYAMLSPMMASEEAFLLGTYIRSLDPRATLVLGPVPQGEETTFTGPTGETTFTIQGEKVPNAAGIRRVIEQLGGPSADADEFADRSTDATKTLKAGWVVGGYLSNWLPATLPAAFTESFTVAQDILPNALTDSANVVLPAAAWAEKDGCWENFNNLIQPFAAAVTPPPGARREGDVFYKLLGKKGLYAAADVRSDMGEAFDLTPPPAASADAEELEYEFVEL